MSKVYAPRSDDGGLKLLTIVYQLIFLRVCRGWVQRSNQSLDKDWTATSGALQLKWVHCLVSYLPASVVQTGLQKSWRAARTRSQGNVYWLEILKSQHSKQENTWLRRLFVWRSRKLAENILIWWVGKGQGCLKCGTSSIGYEKYAYEPYNTVRRTD